jgi:hypothetical protein
MLGQQIIELRDGLNSFQKASFESLYDGKKLSWSKDGSDEVAALTSFVSNSTTEDEINEAPVARKRGPDGKMIEVAVKEAVVEEVVVKEPVVEEVVVKEAVVEEAVVQEAVVEEAVVQDIPIRSMPQVDEVLATEETKIEIMKAQNGEQTDFVSMGATTEDVVTAPVAAKKAAVAPPPPKKAGGFFSFLNSDSAVQNLANAGAPTAPPAVAKAFMTPTPAEAAAAPVVKPAPKPAKKSKEGLNMVMFQQSEEEIATKKAMMADRPTLASAKTEGSRVPSMAPVESPEEGSH